MNELFIGGGGFNGLSFLGVLEYIHQNKLLDLKSVYGCSIGAFIVCCYISGKNPRSILEFLLELNPSDIAKIDIKNIYARKSLIDETFFEKLLECIDFPKDITMKEVYNLRGIHVNIFVTNLTKNLYENVNDTTHPNVKLFDAVRASMSIPFIFPPVNIEDEIFVDGCCKNIYGAHPDNKFILGYSIIKESNVIDKYISSVLTSMISNVKPQGVFIVYCKESNNTDKYYLDIKSIDKMELLRLYTNGINSAKEQLN